MLSIYLDNNATTPLVPEVWEAMQPFFMDIPGNPASSHSFGRKARQALETAREQTATLLGASADEVIFTSGATEANNLAILGLVGEPPASSRRSGHLLISSIEHPCITEPAQQLAQAGFTVEYLPVNSTGQVDPASLPAMLREDTRLISVMLANHETGAIQPIKELAAHLPKGIRFHCDAAASAGKMPIHFHDMGVTSLTISAHKFHGPKGVGALLLRSKNRLHPLLYGGHQQQGRRPGTEPVALAVGMARALELATLEMDQRRAKVFRLRRLFLDYLRQHTQPVVVNGPEEGGIVHTLNLSFPGCLADLLLMNLDLAGIACSTGSACSSGSLLPSPVLQAMKVPDEVLHSAMRFSFSHLLAEGEVADAARRISEVVGRMREADSHGAS